MNSILIKLFEKPFVRNVIILSSGTAGAQVIAFLLIPFITRLYGPEAYGIMGVFIAIIGILTPIAALTYPIAIVLPKKDRDAQVLIQVSIFISLGMAILVSIILLLFNQFIVSLFSIKDVSSFLYLIPFAILFSGFLQVMEQWLIRTKQFQISAKVELTQALLINGGKLGIGFFQPIASVLIFISAIGPGIKAILMGIFSRKMGVNQLFKFSSVGEIKQLAINYKDFPIYRAPQVLINAISINLPVVLLSTFFGTASVGFYSIAISVLSIPSGLIGKSVGDVFYPRISEAAKNSENLTNLIKKAMITLTFFAIVPFGIIILFGPWLFSLVFGSEWGMAGEYSRWIAIWLFFNFVYQPCIKSLPVLSAQSFHLKFTIITLIFNVLSVFGGYYIFSSDLIAIALFGISGAILNIILIIITLRLSAKFDNR